MNSWTKGDDAAVCLSYRDHGVKATPGLLAALSHLPPGSIGMRLQNVEYVATGGARGLSGVSAQTREIWALISAARDAAQVPIAPRKNRITADISRSGGRSGVTG
jgi:hypothetical protein